jgi:NADPH:quinone reductase-like Zn-dependent oxidoreductase
MKAAISTKYGGPEIFEVREVNRPKPKNNEILVKVHASSVSRADTMMRTGKPYFGRLMMGFLKPKHAIPGTGFAGEVVHIGNQVKEFTIGDKVFGESIESFGTNAEFVCVSADGVVAKMPANLKYNEAASICDGALTSMNFLKLIGNIKPGQKVLINGASGSLGSAAVQLAKHFGAEVVGVCGSKNVELVKTLGADKVIDYSKQDFTKSFQIYDLIYDTVGLSSFSKCKNSLTKTGAYISPVLGLTLLSDMMCSSVFGKKKAKFSATGILPVEQLKELLAELVQIIEEGAISTVIDKTYRLNQISEAHAYIDKGHKRGNVVIEF